MGGLGAVPIGVLEEPAGPVPIGELLVGAKVKGG